MLRFHAARSLHVRGSAIWFAGGPNHCNNKYESLETEVLFWLCNSKGIVMVFEAKKVTLILGGAIVVGQDCLVVSDPGLCYFLNLGHHALSWWISKQSTEIREWQRSSRAKRAFAKCTKQDLKSASQAMPKETILSWCKDCRNKCKHDSIHHRASIQT